MVLSPIEIATANRIRVLASLPNATMLDLHGELKILGQQYPELLAEESLVHGAHEIKVVFALTGMAELGMLLRGGDLLVLGLGKDGGNALERHRPRADKAIDHLAFGLYPPRVLAVPRHRPDTILNFASWDAFFGWEKGDDVTQEVTELPSAIDHLIGNLDSFTALLRNGQVCSLSSQATSSQAAVVPTNTSAEVLESTTASYASPSKTNLEEPEISPLLADTPVSAPSKPSSTSVHLAFIQLPAKAKAITTHPLSKIRGIITVEGKAYLLGPPPKPNTDTPSLPSLSPIQKPQPIDFPPIHGTSITSLAIGQSHAVILTASGEIYSAGDGKAGQLGIGDAVFELRANDTVGMKFHPLADEPAEYADHWEKVELGSAEKGRVSEVFAGAETTFFVME